MKLSDILCRLKITVNEDGSIHILGAEPTITTQVAYVDQSGNDTTARLGHPAKPFATVAAAFAAVYATEAAGLIFLGVGAWTANITTDWPANIAICGMGHSLTSLTVGCLESSNRNGYSLNITDIGPKSVNLTATAGYATSTTEIASYNGGDVTLIGCYGTATSGHANYQNDGSSGNISLIDCEVSAVTPDPGSQSGSGSITMVRCVGNANTGNTAAAATGAITMTDCRGNATTGDGLYSGNITMTRCTGNATMGNAAIAGAITMTDCIGSATGGASTFANPGGAVTMLRCIGNAVAGDAATGVGGLCTMTDCTGSGTGGTSSGNTGGDVLMIRCTGNATGGLGTPKGDVTMIGCRGNPLGGRNAHLRGCIIGGSGVDTDTFRYSTNGAETSSVPRVDADGYPDSNIYDPTLD